MANVKKTALKKKKWYSIVGPKDFNSVQIGEVPTLQPETFVGRKISVNLSTLTNDPRKQSTTIIFKIIDYKGAQLDAEIDGLIMAPSHIKRLIRKNKDRVDDSFTITTKDEKKVQVKPFVITRSKVSHRIQTTIRKMIQDHFREQAKEATFNQLFINLLQIKTQRTLKGEIKKIAPVNVIEIRTFKQIA